MGEEPPGRPSGEDHPQVTPAVAAFRRHLAEALGTFLLTAVSIAVAALTPMLGIPVPEPVKAVAPAIVVALVIYSIGDVSGAHINPAVTVAFALRRAFPWARVPGYLLAQVAGAVLAAFAFRLWSPAALSEGVKQPHIGAPAAFLVEAALTAFLVLVILNVATREILVGPGAAIPVGLVITLDGLIGGNITGASMNPARSAGPVVGAIVATLLTHTLHGPYTEAEQQAAQGRGLAVLPRVTWLLRAPGNSATQELAGEHPLPRHFDSLVGRGRAAQAGGP